jgi:hypothetical protein
MTPAEARQILHQCEQDRLDMGKADKTNWTDAQRNENIDRLLRVEAAEERARKCLDEAAEERARKCLDEAAEERARKWVDAAARAGG